MLHILFSKNSTFTTKTCIYFAYVYCLFHCRGRGVMRATYFLQVISSGDKSGDFHPHGLPEPFRVLLMDRIIPTSCDWQLSLGGLWPFTARLSWGGVHMLLCVTKTGPPCVCVYVFLRGFTEVESPSCNTPHDSLSRYDKVIWPLW